MKTFSVWHYNGQGIYSQWYRDASGLSKEDAEKLQKELQDKSCQGWYAGVSTFSDDIDPNCE